MWAALLGCVAPDASSVAPPTSSAEVDTAVDPPPDTAGGSAAPQLPVDSDHVDTAAPAHSADSDPGLDPGGIGRPTRVFVVRHCEKAEDSDDPDLTPEGWARAEALADALATVPLAAVYASDKKRTQETVAPTAIDHHLPIDTSMDPEEELADWILSEEAGETVLSAGHSYTVEDFLTALGATGFSEVDGYGQLWVVTIDADGTVVVDESHFGE